MEIGDRVTWIEFVKGVNRNESGARVTTGIIVGCEGRSNRTRFEIQILWMSGRLPHDVRDRIWLTERDLRIGRAEEWQHHAKFTPLELARQQHQRKVAKMKRNFMRSLRRCRSEAA